VWSDEARVMVRPFRAYAELGERADEDLASPFERVVRFLLVLGAFIAVSTAGRLVPFHVATTFVTWAFVPILQALAVAIATHATLGRIYIKRAIGLYFAGHGPWLVFLLGVAAACVLAPEPQRLIVGLPIGLVVAFVWGVVITVGCFTQGLGLGRRRGAKAIGIFYAVWLLLLATWYVALGQVQTLFRAV
jgi:hypothetical protein